MQPSKDERRFKKLLIKVSSQALGFIGEAYRDFLEEKTGKRQLARMSDQELELVSEELKKLVRAAQSHRREQRALHAVDDHAPDRVEQALLKLLNRKG